MEKSGATGKLLNEQSVYIFNLCNVRLVFLLLNALLTNFSVETKWTNMFFSCLKIKNKEMHFITVQLYDEMSKIGSISFLCPLPIYTPFITYAKVKKKKMVSALDASLSL